jgi:hypothetical protein
MMSKNSDKSEYCTNNFYRQLLTCIGLCCFFFLANYLWNNYTDSQVASVKLNVKHASTTSPGIQNNSGALVQEL